MHTLTFPTVHVTKVNEGRKRGLFTSQHNQQQHNNKQNSSTLHPNLSLTHDLGPFLRFVYGLVRCNPLCLESALQAQVVAIAAAVASTVGMDDGPFWWAAPHGGPVAPSAVSPQLPDARQAAFAARGWLPRRSTDPGRG